MLARSQSRSTFSQAALGHLDSVYGYAASLCQSPAQAEALVQATYRCAARAFGGLPPDDQLKSYLYALARRIWLDQMRCAKGRQRFRAVPHQPAFPTQATAIQGLRTALEQLPRPYREVL